jgi:hypothetical protein
LVFVAPPFAASRITLIISVLLLYLMSFFFAAPLGCDIR